MIADKLIELIEIHALQLSADVGRDLVTNERTPGFHSIPRADLEDRVFRLFHHVGDWIRSSGSKEVQAEFADWGRRRFAQGIALSEIIYAIIILKQHLRRYIRENGLIEATFPRTETDYVLPMHMNSLQELNVQVGQFFDEALYYLAVGYEQAARHH
jgi:hypothetical protein